MKYWFGSAVATLAVGLLAATLASASAEELDVRTLSCKDFNKLGDVYAGMAISEADGFLVASLPDGKLTVPSDDDTFHHGLSAVRAACASNGDAKLLDIMKGPPQQ